MTSAHDKNWSFGQVWNNSLEMIEPREYDPRDYLWATELGKAPVDVYLRLKGTAPSNPPNARSMRKFEAGNVFEWITMLILKRGGILVDEQVKLRHQYPGLLMVSGKADFIAGGTPDFARGLAELKALDMPEVFVRAAEHLKEHFEKNYPAGLPTKPLEIKSVGSFMFESILKAKKPMKQHKFQILHYLKAGNFPQGNIVYISRDDMRIIEMPVILNEATEAEYKAEIEKLSGYYFKDERPSLEDPIIYDEEMEKFAANWRVGYSMYLTLLYGIRDQAEFDSTYKGTPARWNRVLNRFREDKPMTKKNIEVIAEIKDAGFDIAKIAMSKSK